SWNFGPGAGGEITVGDLVGRMGERWSLLRVEKDGSPQLREAPMLRLNVEKAARCLGWQPVWDIDTTLQRTAGWYIDFHQEGQVGSRGDLVAYVAEARRMGLAWAA